MSRIISKFKKNNKSKKFWKNNWKNYKISYQTETSKKRLIYYKKKEKRLNKKDSENLRNK